MEMTMVSVTASGNVTRTASVSGLSWVARVLAALNKALDASAEGARGL